MEIASFYGLILHSPFSIRRICRELMYSTALAKSASGQLVCGAVGKYGAGPNSGSTRTGRPRACCVVHMTFHHDL